MSVKKFRVVKPEIRVLGVDDGSFIPHHGYAPIVGVVFRGGYWLEGVLSTKVKVDGFDATSKIASMITSSPHYCQVRVIMLDGITFAGFNIVNIEDLNHLTKLPIIAITRDKPNFDDIKEALKNLPNSTKRWEAIKAAGKVIVVPTKSRGRKIYMEICGIQKSDAQKIVQLTSTRSHIPEALRVAHFIASGTSRLTLNT